MNDKQNTFLLIYIPTGRRFLFHMDSLLTRRALGSMCLSSRCHAALYDPSNRELAACSTSCPAYHSSNFPWAGRRRPSLLDFIRPEFLSLFLIYTMDSGGDFSIMTAEGTVGLTFRECSGSDFLHAFPWYGQLSQEAIQDYICNSVIPNEFK